MILACHNLSKSFGDQVIVKDGSFHIENHEKAALVGLNGAGKSTILKMIVGQLSPDAGTVVLTKGKTLGYLAQHQEMESGIKRNISGSNKETSAVLSLFRGTTGERSRTDIIQ